MHQDLPTLHRVPSIVALNSIACSINCVPATPSWSGGWID